MTTVAAAANDDLGFEGAARQSSRGSSEAALEHARILVVGASALSGQILKNLVLPGLGGFTVLDDALVTARDIGTNFFLQAGESEGKPYATELARLVAELNPSVAHAGHVEVRRRR